MTALKIKYFSRISGFSLLELLVVIIIISTLLGFAIEKLLKLQVQAERSSMQSMVGTLQSAIALTISEHIAKGRIPQLKKYLNTNPMSLLANTPVNYLGSFDGRPDNPEPASWWFEQDSQTLVYLVLNQGYFVTDSIDLQQKGYAKFKIMPVYDDNNSNGRFDRRDTLKGIHLSPLAKYRWSQLTIETNETL